MRKGDEEGKDEREADSQEDGEMKKDDRENHDEGQERMDDRENHDEGQERMGDGEREGDDERRGEDAEKEEKKGTNSSPMPGKYIVWINYL